MQKLNKEWEINILGKRLHVRIAKRIFHNDLIENLIYINCRISRMISYEYMLF